MGVQKNCGYCLFSKLPAVEFGVGGLLRDTQEVVLSLPQGGSESTKALDLVVHYHALQIKSYNLSKYDYSKNNTDGNKRVYILTVPL